MNFNNNYSNYSRDSIIKALKENFINGSNLSKLIYANLAVYLIIKLLGVILFMFGFDFKDQIIECLSVPTSMSTLLIRPWSIFTYMFVHKAFLHVLFNILWLYWFGIILLNYIGEKKLLSIYIIGGLTGAAFYIFSFNTFSFFEGVKNISYAYGSSASVMAIIVATVFYAPNHIVNLALIGKVKIKYIALFFVLFKILQIPSSSIGEHIIHLGGAFYGWLFISQLMKGKDISLAYNSMVDSVFKFLSSIIKTFSSKSKMKVSYKSTKNMSDSEYNKNKTENKEEINIILDKISKSGYDSLNSKEKELLFKSSK